MAKKKGAMRRDPKMRTQPVDKATKAERRQIQRQANRTPTERLSPGVYRSQGGGLVTQGGQRIRRQPQAPMGAGEIGQQIGQMPGQAEQAGQRFGQMPGQAEQVGQRFGGRALTDAERMARGIDPRDPNQYWMNPSGEVMGTLIGWSPQESSPQIGGAPTLNSAPIQNPWAPQMPQPSANQGGQYRLSPGVYGTREQAMQQYNQQMQDMMAQYRMPSVPQQRRG